MIRRYRRLAKSANMVLMSQPWRRRLVRLLVRIAAADPDIALVHTVAAGGEQRVEVRAAEAKVRNSAVGRGDDAIDAAGLIAHLDAQTRRHVQPTVAVHSDAVCAAVIGSVRHVQMIITLLVRQRTIRLNLITINPDR